MNEQHLGTTGVAYFSPASFLFIPLVGGTMGTLITPSSLGESIHSQTLGSFFISPTPTFGPRSFFQKANFLLATPPLPKLSGLKFDFILLTSY